MNGSNGKSKVVAVPCRTYDEETVYSAVKAGIDELGGIGAFVGTHERILVKPNFLMPADADKAVVTHPSVILAVLRLLNEAGCTSVKYGDSPGHGSCVKIAGRIGLPERIKELGLDAAAAAMSSETTVSFPDGMACRKFYFAKEAAESDAIIGVCKMKTHQLERITGAVKNMYGLVCGYRKAAGHVKYPNASVFARMLSDIHRCMKPRLHVMDGIAAMEGNGPASGNTVAMNLLLFSADPVAMDAVFCRLVDLNPELVPTNAQGEAMGIGTMDFNRIDIVVREPYPDVCKTLSGTQSENALCQAGTDAHGAVAGETVPPHTVSHAESPCRHGYLPGEYISIDELVRRYGNPGFDVERTGSGRSFLGRYSDAMTAIAKKPYIDDKLCVKCGVCVEHCPVPGKALSFSSGRERPPQYDYTKCIRCYCCQEMCPQHAIKTRY